MTEYCPPYGGDNALENITLCTWKATLNDNLQGKGTSFDPQNLTKTQEKCYYCNGFNYECKNYIILGEQK